MGTKDFRSFQVEQTRHRQADGAGRRSSGLDARKICTTSRTGATASATARPTSSLPAIAAVRRQGVPIVEVARDNFPLGRICRHSRRCAARADGRPRHRHAAELSDRAVRPGGDRDRLYRARRLSRQDHVAEQAGSRARPCEGSRRRLRRSAHARLHDPRRDVLPCRRLRLRRACLCLQTSKSGGASRVASSVTVYNRILARRPDLAKVLTEDFYRSRSGEMNPGEAPFFKQPIFSFTDGYFSATGASAVVDKAQKLPGVPKFTDAAKGGGRALSRDRGGMRARYRLQARATSSSSTIS